MAEPNQSTKRRVRKGKSKLVEDLNLINITGLQGPRKNDEVELNIKKFDPHTMRPYSTVLFAGGRRTGKSSLMRDIIGSISRRFYDMHVFTGTIEDDHPWTDMTPAKYVHICKHQ